MIKGSVNDWATKCAERIYDDFRAMDDSSLRDRDYDCARLAAIIATYAEPLMRTLRESKKEHSLMCPCWSDPDELDPCTCDAGPWNEKVDAILDGEPEPAT